VPGAAVKSRDSAVVTHIRAGASGSAEPLPGLEEGERLVAFSDIQNALLLSAAWLIAWTVPERLWPRACSALTWTTRNALLAGSRSQVRQLPAKLAELIGTPTAAGALAAIKGHFYHQCLGVLRGYRPGGWHPCILLLGREHIDEALARGRGAILYNSDFAYAHTVVRMALHATGFRISALARPSHTFSNTRLGMRFLNPVQGHFEDRYAAERIVLHADAPGGAALNSIRQRVQENRVVQVFAGHLGRRTADVEFLDGEMRLATGPAWLAQTTGVALLPTFAVMNGRGDFEVHVEPALTLVEDAGKALALEAVLTRYAGLLQHYVERYPDQWRGWETGLLIQPGNPETLPAAGSATIA